jgi:integral membrane protein
LRAALRRYRVLANVVGVVLVVFLLVAVPLRYLGGEPRLSETISPIHGFLYIVYLGVTLDLARRASWTVGRTLLVALAGTVPFLSFVVERRMTRDVETRMAT